MTKRFVFLLASVLMTAFVWAEDMISIHRVSQQEVQQVASAIGKMTFDDGQLTVISLEGTVLYTAPISQEISIVINENNAKIGEEEFEIITSVENLFQNAALDPNATYRFFSVNGNLMTITAGNGVKAAMSALPGGMYILVGNNTILKIRK